MSLKPQADQAMRRVLAQVDALGLFPQAAMQIHEIASDPEATQRDMEKVLALEPALSAQVLRIANSPFYGLRRNVSNLRQAIFVLGFRAIQGLSISMAVMHMGRAGNRDQREAWKHSLAAGVAAQALGARSNRALAADAFVAALLHDIGKALILQLHQGDAYQDINDTELTAEQRILAEQETFGFDHAMLGAACLESWGLPNNLVQAVGTHHNTDAITLIEDESGRWIAEMVWLANQVAHHQADGSEPELLMPRLLQSGLNLPEQLGKDAIMELLERLGDDVSKMAGRPVAVRSQPEPEGRPRRTGRKRVSRDALRRRWKHPGR